MDGGRTWRAAARALGLNCLSDIIVIEANLAGLPAISIQHGSSGCTGSPGRWPSRRCCVAAAHEARAQARSRAAGIAQ